MQFKRVPKILTQCLSLSKKKKAELRSRNTKTEHSCSPAAIKWSFLSLSYNISNKNTTLGCSFSVWLKTVLWNVACDCIHINMISRKKLKCTWSNDEDKASHDRRLKAPILRQGASKPKQRSSVFTSFWPKTQRKRGKLKYEAKLVYMYEDPCPEVLDQHAEYKEVKPQLYTLQLKPALLCPAWLFIRTDDGVCHQWKQPTSF